MRGGGCIFNSKDNDKKAVHTATIISNKFFLPKTNLNPKSDVDKDLQSSIFIQELEARQLLLKLHAFCLVRTQVYMWLSGWICVKLTLNGPIFTCVGYFDCLLKLVLILT